MRFWAGNSSHTVLWAGHGAPKSGKKKILPWFLEQGGIPHQICIMVECAEQYVRAGAPHSCIAASNTPVED